MTGMSPRTATAIVIGTLAAITGLRFAVSEPGPLYLVPAVLAGLWLGMRAGIAVGAAGALLWLLSSQGDGTLVGMLVRVVIFGVAGGLVGSLAESRERLAGQLRRKDLALEELRTIQEALAPSEPPQRPALELATCYLPAEHGVSGDFFLVAPAADDATVIAVGDVAGRGLEAAKRAWYVRTLLATSAELGDDPATMLERANRSLVADSGYASPFVTVACVLFRPGGRVEWALAGHDDPIALSDGSTLPGNGDRGLPLGVTDRIGARTSSAHLGGHGGCLIYTDGLTEARRARAGGNGETELFGEHRVSRVVAELDSSVPAKVVETVQGEVRRFSGGQLADDLCLVALRPSGDPDTEQVC